MNGGMKSRLVVGALYLVGAFVLLPGFVWIIPEKVLKIPVGPGVFIDVPKFGPRYADAIHLLIWGMSLILSASILDLVLIHCLTVCQMSGQPWTRLCRVLGPILQVLGAAVILLGCIVFLPQYQFPKPRDFNGIKAPDLANDLFKLGAVLYFVAAVFGAVGTVVQAKNRRERESGRSLAVILLPLPAFILFMFTSVCYFVNGMLPTSQAIEAGQLRLAGTVGMVTAVVILTIDMGLEISGKKGKVVCQAADARECLTAPAVV